MQQLTNPYDATNSWSGYNYQGKVAIYVVLEKICWLKANGKLGEISNYSLELEWLEDFSILYNNEYKTIHQVKALNSSSISTYKSALLKLAEKSSCLSSIEKTYLHTWKRINLGGVEWKKTLKDILDQYDISILKLQLTSSIKKNEIDNTLKILLDEDDYESQDYYISLIRSEIKEGVEITAELLKTVIPSIIEKLKSTQIHAFSNLSLIPLDKILLYDYDGQNHMDLVEIEKKICIKIDQLLKILEDDYRAGDSDCIKAVYHYLWKVIDDNVVARHLTYSNKGEKIKIPLDDFYKIILNKNLDYTNEKYYLIKLKSWLLDCHTEYCLTCMTRNQDSAACKTCDVSRAIEDIQLMTYNEFELFCRILSLDVGGKIDNPVAFKNFFQTLGVKSFFRILRDIHIKYQRIQQSMRYIDSDKKTLLLSALFDNGDDTSTSFVCQKILENEYAVGTLMEIDEIITRDLTAQSIFKSAENVTDVYDISIDYDSIDSDHITHCKNTALISIENAKERLNND